MAIEIYFDLAKPFNHPPFFSNGNLIEKQLEEHFMQLQQKLPALFSQPNRNLY